MPPDLDKVELRAYPNNDEHYVMSSGARHLYFNGESKILRCAQNDKNGRQ